MTILFERARRPKKLGQLSTPCFSRVSSLSLSHIFRLSVTLKAPIRRKQLVASTLGELDLIKNFDLRSNRKTDSNRRRRSKKRMSTAVVVHGYSAPFATAAPTASAARGGTTGISFASVASRTAGTGTATSSAVIVDSTGGVDSSSLLEYFTKVSVLLSSPNLSSQGGTDLVVHARAALYRCPLPLDTFLSLRLHSMVRDRWNSHPLVNRLSSQRYWNGRKLARSVVQEVVDQKDYLDKESRERIG